MVDKNPKPTARDRILLTAHDLFYRDGIRATGIDRIIKEAGVTKVTFYRHYPSKNELILAYLEYRHGYWMAWFEAAVQRHAENPSRTPVSLIVSVLREWFESQAFRGCAFINTTAEFDGAIAGVGDTIRRHKAGMNEALRKLFKDTRLEGREVAVGLAVDGAIVRTQIDGVPDAALQGLTEILTVLQK
ncbi:MAG: TetR/AcrR family transcriptional regulator [Fluviibacter sp.]